MNSFERALLGDMQIPSEEAAGFFIGIRRPLQKTASAMTKTAGWEDPPDETGVFEGQFEIPIEHAVALMGNCAKNLLRLMNASLIYGKSIRGPFSGEVKKAIQHCEWDHTHAFEYLVERMTVLLGAPHIPEVDMAPPSTEPLAVAQRMIRAEQEMINSYHELFNVLGQNPMKWKVKEFMGQCQEHLDGYWMALPPDYGIKPMTPRPPDMLAKHEEHETPEQEAIESPEFEAAEEEAGVEPPEHHVEGGEPASPEPLKTAAMKTKKSFFGGMPGMPGMGGGDFHKMMQKATGLDGLQGMMSGGGEKTSFVRSLASLLVKTAKEGVSDDDLRETGRQRAVTNIASEHHREAARRGERAGKVLGALGGAAGGGALGHHLSKGHPLGTLGGAALGAALGHHAGGEVGTEVDIARHKKSAAISKLGSALAQWVKLADDAALGGSAEQEAPMASPTDNQELSPVNYMQAEAIGQQQQNKVEASYYRRMVQQTNTQAQQQVQAAQQQAAQIQQQAQQAMQEAAEADNKVKAALDEALKAKDDALKQTETAARMRIAQQNLRTQLMQLAAQDPDAAAAMQLTQTTGQAAAVGSSRRTRARSGSRSAWRTGCARRRTCRRASERAGGWRRRRRTARRTGRSRPSGTNCTGRGTSRGIPGHECQRRTASGPVA